MAGNNTRFAAERPAVLMTDGLLRKTLCAARSLGSKGIPVDVADKLRWTPAGFSNCCRASLVSPDPEAEPEAWAEWLLGTLEDRRIGVFMPMDDSTVELSIRWREEIARRCRIVLPPSESFAIASDKYLTAKLAREAGVPCPEAWLPASQEELRALMERLTFPVVVKPRKSSGSRGIRLAGTMEELLIQYEAVKQIYGPPMIQACIPQGERLDVCLLYDGTGRSKATFVQKELRHYPLHMGPSTAQESIWAPELAETAEALMSKLPWLGVVELEFMRDPRDGIPKLMEINPRFWNSLHLAVQCGVDYPYLLYQTALNGKSEAVTHYETGRICRNLIPGDLLHFLANPDRFRLEPPLLGSQGGKIEDDILSAKDPLPAWGAVLAAGRLAVQPEIWRMLIKR